MDSTEKQNDLLPGRNTKKSKTNGSENRFPDRDNHTSATGDGQVQDGQLHMINDGHDHDSHTHATSDQHNHASHAHATSDQHDHASHTHATSDQHDHASHAHATSDDHDHDHSHNETNTRGWLKHWDLLTALIILVVLLTLRYAFRFELSSSASLITNVAAYILAGRQVLYLAARKVRRGDFFNEFVLMSVATLGAFLIGEYEEGVAVMVFYQIGEWFQDSAVSGAKKSIRALLDIRSNQVTVLRDGNYTVVDPASVDVSETIRVKPGEKVALDGELISESAVFNTAALTGESKPDTKYKNEKVYAGMVNTNTVADILVTSKFNDSRLSQILSMVQDAAARKSQTQLFISRFAKWYTPFVFLMAFVVCVGPALVVDDYRFEVWFYRALVFLVISCPCALVVSIPLGYFGGIGLASKNGILFKGGNYLDVMARVDTVVMDKTGTLTKGIFKVQEVVSEYENFIQITASLELNSTHPVARAIVTSAGDPNTLLPAINVTEVPGHGVRGTVSGKAVIAGNAAMMKQAAIIYPEQLDAVVETVVMVAIDGHFAGYIVIADELKEDAAEAIARLRDLNIRTAILSGDKQSIVGEVADSLGVTEAFGDLLPDGKVAQFEKLRVKGQTIAFVGDGVNDAPVLALADAGIAMGGLGSDASIETADIVIQNDQPSKIVSSIKIGKITRNIVWQNIILAFAVKIVVLGLGAGGVATLWEAVIADVGVALLAILNAARVQHLKI